MSAWPRGAKYLRVPIYDQNVHLIFDRKVAERCYAYLKVDMTPTMCGAGFTQQLGNEDGTKIHIVAVFDGGHRTLVHELSHLTWNILSLVRVKAKPNNNEAYAYLLDWLYGQTAPMLPKPKRAKR